jgi:transposase
VGEPERPEARITRLQDGRTRLAYKPEHAVDLDTEAIVAAEIQPADRGDTTTLGDTLEATAWALDAAGCAPTIERPAELIAAKGYHSRAVLKELDGGPWQTRIAEPRPKAVQRWRGDLDARRAVYGNRARLRSGSARRRSRCGPRRSSAASRSSSTGAACAGPICAAGRTSRSAISSMLRATTSAWCCAS